MTPTHRWVLVADYHNDLPVCTVVTFSEELAKEMVVLFAKHGCTDVTVTVEERTPSHGVNC